MNARLPTARWPVPEVLLLLVFPFVFYGPSWFQQLIGRLPGMIQFIIPFMVAAAVVFSAGRLAMAAVRCHLRARTAICAVCVVLGLLAFTFAALVLRGLGVQGREVASYAMAGAVLGIFPFILVDLLATGGAESRHRQSPEGK